MNYLVGTWHLINTHHLPFGSKLDIGKMPCKHPSSTVWLKIGHRVECPVNTHLLPFGSKLGIG